MNIYSDFGFEVESVIQTGITEKINDTSIKQSIKNILFTHKGEVPFNPLFGSGIYKLLFEKMNAFTELLLKEEIIVALANFESRVEIEDIIINMDFDNNNYNVTIKYKIIYLDSSDTISLDFALQGV